MKITPITSVRKGFLLMESLLSFSIFGVAVTSIVVALPQTAEVSQEINRESWAQTRLENLLKEVITLPVSEENFERDEIVDIPDAKARIEITPHTEILHSDDPTATPLAKMFDINITLYWDEDGSERTKSAHTLHYYPLHQRR